MWTAGLCVMLAVCTVTASLTGAWGDAYKKGASGATVTEIQTVSYTHLTLPTKA